MNESIPVKRLNHVALKVRDLDPALGRLLHACDGDSPKTWAASATTSSCSFGPRVRLNHHDLALLKIGPNATDAKRTIGRPVPLRLASRHPRRPRHGAGRTAHRGRLLPEPERSRRGRRPSTGATLTATRSRSRGSCPARSGVRGRPTCRSRRRWTSTPSSPTGSKPAIQRYEEHPRSVPTVPTRQRPDETTAAAASADGPPSAPNAGSASIAGSRGQ